MDANEAKQIMKSKATPIGVWPFGKAAVSAVQFDCTANQVVGVET
jgi:hypothetical protein